MAEENLAGLNPDFAAQFLENVRGTVPLTIEQIDTMLRLIEAARGQDTGLFLDLGCGDGVLSAAILDELPQAKALLVELSEPMLSVARRQMQARANRIEFIQADFHQAGWAASVAKHGPLDAIVSGFAIHHLADARKQALYEEIFGLLAPGGIFINIEHVSSATRWTESVWDDYTIDAIFGKELKALPGKTRAEVAREYYSRAGEDAHILAPLEVQCDWLREIGFESVECFLKVQELAVFGGVRPES